MDVNKEISQYKQQNNNNNYISEVIKLAKNNYAILAQYLQPQSLTQHINNQPQFPIYQTISHTTIQQLYNTLLNTQRLLTETIPKIENQQATQYNYLRNLWQIYKQKNNKQQQMMDKFDNLNRIISMVKLRTKQIIQKQYRQYNRFWDKQVEQTISGGAWELPIFQKMNEKLTSSTMKYSQLQQKILKTQQHNTQLTHKNTSIQQKLQQSKQKIKKLQKQIFQLSKKKLQLQKQILIRNNNNKRQENIRQNKCNIIQYDTNGKQKYQQKDKIDQIEKDGNGNKQNIESINSNYTKYLLLVQQQHNISKNTQNLTQLQADKSLPIDKIRDKYRYVKNLIRRSTTYISPNTSLDSIKSVKFQRSSNKKLIIKRQ